MTDLVIASSEADASAAEAVVEHHAQLAGVLALKAEALSAAARARSQSDADELREDLVVWCRRELVPHALAEETTLYAAAGRMVEARLLVEAMLAEHQVLVGIVEELSTATDMVSAASHARALRVLFEVHLAKENEQILPLLVADPTVSVAELLGGMHELLGGSATEPEVTTDDAGHACGCGEVDPSGYPELDARAIPHAIRHATIFGALDGVRPGKGLVLVAPHDPLPLLGQLEKREPGAFAVDYLERGPEAWRLLLVRAAS